MYEIILSKKAQKKFNKLEAQWQRRVSTALNDISNTTDLHNKSIKLKERGNGDYRWRVGDLRIFYNVNKSVISVVGVVFRTDHTYKR
ncbi:hypothetical protein TNCT_478471 [Trichonephila clavata]|uniref:Type II toxin-antitoxin system RelE/ParE family toxin n=1 Tax=Trichonephila clavata TaxID=2740835 RepID=A0A8X6LSY8_TRICU|nr:hypothetical protein TNCT_478471 [Trichonephila clavata]